MRTRSHLKKRIWAQDQGGAKFQSADILRYFEDLKRGPNVEIGFKDFFEIASKHSECRIVVNVFTGKLANRPNRRTV